MTLPAGVDALLSELQLDWLIAARAENVLWLSGHRPLWGAAVVVGVQPPSLLQPPLLFAPARELELSPGPLLQTVPFTPDNTAQGLLEALLPLLGAARRVGLDLPGVLSAATHPGGEVRALSGAVGELLRERGLEVTDVSVPLERLRAVKSPLQVQLIERAVQAGLNGLRNAQVHLKPGLSELELGSLVELEVVRAALSLGGTRARAYAFPMAGRNAEQAGNLISDATPRELQAGDLVVTELAVCVDGYWADLTRTYAVGTPTPAQVRLLGAVRRAHGAARAALRPGVPAHQVDAAARASLDADGLGTFFTHGVGHGVGFAYHEWPALGPDAQGTLAQGMVVTIEPAAYVPGLGGARHENNLLVTASGARMLGGEDSD